MKLVHRKEIGLEELEVRANKPQVQKVVEGSESKQAPSPALQNNCSGIGDIIVGRCHHMPNCWPRYLVKEEKYPCNSLPMIIMDLASPQIQSLTVGVRDIREGFPDKFVGLYQHYRLFRNYMHSGMWEMLGSEFSDSVKIHNLMVDLELELPSLQRHGHIHLLYETSQSPEKLFLAH